MSKNVLLLSFCCLLLIITGCAKESNNVKVEVIEGIEYVHNPETPLHPEKTVSFKEELTIGEQVESDEIHLYEPSVFSVDANDNIFVSDRSDQTIKVFDENGKYVRTIGVKGSGPGEFQMIGNMAFLPDGRFFVMDMANRRTSFFNPDGTFLKSWSWKSSHFSMFMTTDSSIVISENIFAKERKLYVKSYNMSGEELFSFGEFTPYIPKIQRKGGMAIAIATPFPVRSIFAGDQKSQFLYHCLNNNYLIEVYDQSGKLFRKIDRPYEALPFTSKDLEEYQARMEKNRSANFPKDFKIEIEGPEIKTVAARLLVDNQGNLWVHTNEKKEKEGKVFTAYDIFNKDGFYDTKVWCDVSPRLFVNGKMYSLTTDEETGIKTIKRYRVVWSNEIQSGF